MNNKGVGSYSKTLLFILIICLIYMVDLNNSQVTMPLRLEENLPAQNILTQLKGNDRAEDPCIDTSVFTCEKLAGTEYWVVKEIKLQRLYSVTTPITQTLDVFRYATYVLIGVDVMFSYNLFDRKSFPYGDVGRFLQPVTLEIQDTGDGWVFSNATGARVPEMVETLHFGMVRAPLPGYIFDSSTNLTTLIIDDVVPPFTFPNPMPLFINDKLKNLVCTLYYDTPFVRFSSSLRSLETISLTFDNDQETSSYKDYSLPNFADMPNLKEISLSFVQTNPGVTQKWDFDQGYEVLSNLKSLSISGVGIKIKEKDLSGIARGAFVSIDGSCTELLQCTTQPCFKMPPESTLAIKGCSFPIESIDFRNIESFTSEGNELSQNLPGVGTVVNNIQHSKMKLFSVQNNNIGGPLPAAYCQMKDGVLRLSNTKLTGVVPSCFQCVGGSKYGSRLLFPNSFDGFDETTPATACPTFTISTNYNRIVKTDGTSKVTITGTDFGWVSTTADPPVIDVTVPNKEMVVSYPKGIGKDLTFTAKFLDDQKEQIFQYSYESPSIKSYSYTNIDGVNYFTLNGNGFDYVGNNLVVIDVSNFDGPPAVETTSNYGAIIFKAIDPTAVLEEGKKFVVSITVGGQTSPVASFTFFKTILVTSLPQLSTLGGTVKLQGYFTSSDISLVKVIINDVPCNVHSISQTELEIAYPAVPGVSHYPIEINIGGLKYNEFIEYIELPTERPIFGSSDDYLGGSSSLSIYLLSTITISLILLIVM